MSRIDSHRSVAVGREPVCVTAPVYALSVMSGAVASTTLKNRDLYMGGIEMRRYLHDCDEANGIGV